MRMMPEKPWFLAISAAALISALLVLSSFITGGYSPTTTRSILCSLSSYSTLKNTPSSPALLSTQISETILHYATSTIIPQQTQTEIRISFPVLLRRRPCNFLVFGLGFDSQMWAAFNLGGHTLFLEEDPKWVATVVGRATFLNAKTVRYPTQLKHSDDLIREYKSEPTCLPSNAFVKGNKRCKLALGTLPEEVYEKEWDLIMIDAPKGYFPAAPGRMGAIWTAAVMARNRKGEGVTDVFLHDVNRKVEKQFALEFLCKKYLVDGAQRLWHFQIPKVNASSTISSDRFC